MSPSDAVAADPKKNDPIDAVKINDKIAQYHTSANKGGLPAISLEFFPPKSKEGVLVSHLAFDSFALCANST
jgi:hypothetical protein